MKRMRKQFTLSLLCGWVIAAFCLAYTPTLAHAANYNVIDLGELVANGKGLANGMNNASPVEVVGASQLRSLVSLNAFGWVNDGSSMTNLGDLGSLNGSSANAVNDSGTWVGTADSGIGAPHAVYGGTSPATITDLNSLTLSDTNWLLKNARDVNNAGKIVGIGEYDFGSDGFGAFYDQRGFILTPNPGGTSQITRIDLLLPSMGLGISDAYAINESDQVAGESRHAFVYDSGSLYDLGFLLGLFPNSGARDINESGQVVGWVHSAVARDRPFIITPEYSDPDGDGNPWYNDTSPADGINDLMLNLGTLAATNVSFAQAFALNDFGDVVGWSTPASNPGDLNDKHAFLWPGSGPLLDLNSLISDPNWVLRVATDINNAGYIAGWGLHTIGTQTIQRPFLLAPNPAVPEPATLLLLGTGLAGLGLVMRKRKAA